VKTGFRSRHAEKATESNGKQRDGPATRVTGHITRVARRGETRVVSVRFPFRWRTHRPVADRGGERSGAGVGWGYRCDIRRRPCLQSRLPDVPMPVSDYFERVLVFGGMPRFRKALLPTKCFRRGGPGIVMSACQSGAGRLPDASVPSTNRCRRGCDISRQLRRSDSRVHPDSFTVRVWQRFRGTVRRPASPRSRSPSVRPDRARSVRCRRVSGGASGRDSSPRDRGTALA